MAEQQVSEKPQEPPKQDQPQLELRPNPQPATAVENVSGVVQQLKQERERAQKEVKTFDAAIAALGSLSSNSQPPQESPQSAPAEANSSRPNLQPAATAAQAAQAKPQAAPVEAEPPGSMARRLIVPLVVILILAAVGFVVWKVFFSAPPIPANVVQLSGRIEGDDSAVSPKTSGRILEIRVREGDRVATGDIIAVLDDEQLR